MSASPEVGAALQVGDAPVLENPREADIGLGVNDDDRCATQVQLLDDAESDALQAAHDDVIAHLVFHLRSQFQLVAQVFVISDFLDAARGARF